MITIVLLRNVYSPQAFTSLPEYFWELIGVCQCRNFILIDTLSVYKFLIGSQFSSQIGRHRSLVEWSVAVPIPSLSLSPSPAPSI